MVMFLMQKLNHARDHRLDGNVLNFVGISGGVARRYAGPLITLDRRVWRLKRADEEGIVVDIGNDKTERGRPWKFLIGKELQGGGVLVPGAVLLGLTLAGRFVEEGNRMNVCKDGHRHAADSREVDSARQMSAVNPADSLYSG